MKVKVKPRTFYNNKCNESAMQNLFLHTATQLWRNKVAKIANNHKEVKFAIADEDEHSHLLAEFGLDDSGEEINIACYGPDGKKYPMEPMEEWEDDEVEEYITKMKKGRVSVCACYCIICISKVELD